MSIPCLNKSKWKGLHIFLPYGFRMLFRSIAISLSYPSNLTTYGKSPFRNSKIIELFVAQGFLVATFLLVVPITIDMIICPRYFHVMIFPWYPQHVPVNPPASSMASSPKTGSQTLAAASRGCLVKASTYSGETGLPTSQIRLGVNWAK